MILSSDLRLGNLVEYKNEVVKVYEIRKTFIGAKEENRFPYFLLAEDFEPIPITENWLMKFGFWKQESNWFVIKYSTDCQEASEVFCISYNLNSKRLSFNEEGEDGMVYVGYNIQYVHEIQNLYYALTKTELEL